MNIDWIIPCRFVEVHDNLGTLVGAGIDTFWLPTLPAPVGVAMAVRLTGLPEELQPDVGHTVRNVIRGPDGQTVSDVSGTLNVTSSQRIERHDWLQGVMLPTLVRFQAEAEGTYAFEHIVDDSSASVPMHVVLGTPP